MEKIGFAAAIESADYCNVGGFEHLFKNVFFSKECSEIALMCGTHTFVLKF